MTFPEQYRADLLKAIESIDLNKVSQAIEWFRESRDTGRHIFVCGNGGSAATASHFACDIVKGCSLQPVHAVSHHGADRSARHHHGLLQRCRL